MTHDYDQIVEEHNSLLAERDQYRRDFVAMSERAAELARRVTELEQERDSPVERSVSADDIRTRPGPNLLRHAIAWHEPTGLAVASMTGESYESNRDLAIAKLRTALSEVTTIWRKP